MAADESIHIKLKVRRATLNHEKVTGNMAEYKQLLVVIPSGKAIKQVKHWCRDKVESQLNALKGLQTITDYKGKTSHVADTNVLLSDRLNTFFARFEDNTVP